MRLEVIIVVTPAAVAISTAISFVSNPPVSKLEPRVAVLTAAINSYSAIGICRSNGLPCVRMSAVDLDDPLRGIFPRVNSVQSIHVIEEEYSR